MGKSAEDLIERGPRPAASARPSLSGWAVDDILPLLSRRVAELEERLATVQADLQAERSRLATYAEADRSLNEAAADSYRSADAILQRARAEADKTLSAAADERRMLLNDVARLRDERNDLHAEIASLRNGEHPAAPQAEQPASRPATDLRTAIAEEMRTLLVELAADFRGRPTVPLPTVESVPSTTGITTDEVVNEPILEHLDELARPVPSEPVVDEYVEDLRGSRPLA